MFALKIYILAGCRHVVGARRLHQTQRQHFLFDDTVNELARATPVDGESRVRGRTPEGKRADERKNARTPHTMYVCIYSLSFSSLR